MDLQCRWHDAIRTLAKLHRVDFKAIGLSSFGKHAGFFDRQISTFKTISHAQASAVDVETHKPVGQIPHFEEMVSFFSDPKTQPRDRGTIVHGDYKIDNMVFHKTEPRVIGILDWEMATIGHPLSDLANLTNPYLTAGSQNVHPGPASSAPTGPSPFDDGVTPGLPSQPQLVKWYEEVAGWEYAPKELTWGDAFNIFRSTMIFQGIAARYAMRQASSAKAKEYGERFIPFGEFAWGLVEGLMKGERVRSKL